MEIFVCPQTVHSYECGADILMKPEALLHWIQEAAEDHASRLGFGYDFCRENGCAWVETGITARIRRWPKWKEKVEMETWTFPSSPLVATRDFRLGDAQGETIIKATTQWVLISLDKRRPVPLKRVISRFPNEEGTPLLAFPEERAVAWDSASVRLFHAERHEVDFNGHINNSTYLNWALDSLTEPEWSEMTLKALTIRFLKETLSGMEVESRSVRGDRNSSLHHLFSEGRERARVLLEWEMNDKKVNFPFEGGE